MSVTYSLLIPLYNEEESLIPLWQEITSVMDPMHTTWEAVFVNDGSTDGSQDVLTHLSSKHPHIQVIHFSHNQGKAAALQAGFRAVEGDIIITMDADLQDNPQEIPRLIETLNAGYDLVTGLKANRRDPLHKTVPSFFFNALIRRVSGVQLRDINSGLKAYRKPVVKRLNVYGELYRFIPILAASEGFKVTEIPVHHRERKFGHSKYGFSRFMRGFLDLLTVSFLTKFLKRPLHFFGSLGLFFLGIGVTISAYLTYAHFVLDATVGRRPLLLFGTVFIIAGIQLISTGLIAELITYYVQRIARAYPGEAAFASSSSLPVLAVADEGTSHVFTSPQKHKKAVRS